MNTEMETWVEVDDWRRRTRPVLLTRRQMLSRRYRGRVRRIVIDELRRYADDVVHGWVSYYWPIKGEIDARRAFGVRGRAALPVVIERHQPMEFWAWPPGTELQRGVWNIPIPARRLLVNPSVLLVPLLGFDLRGYRLGYGGGYYDRTLAVMSPRPLLIGIGLEIGRLETIYPQPHDVPMDAVVTETGFQWTRTPDVHCVSNAQG